MLRQKSFQAKLRNYLKKMGVNLRGIATRIPISLDDLAGKWIAIDSYNAIYQFLSIIRGRRGDLLRDKKGRVTSHLSGLFYRTCNLLEKGIIPVYVFDGTPPSLKEAEIRRRKMSKERAIRKYEEALRKGDLEKARTYAQATAFLKDEMVEDAKELLSCMGVNWVQAPSEGEAQAAYMAMKGSVWAVASQDYDSLLFGAPRLIRNLAITGKRKLPGKKAYIKVSLELIELKSMLAELGITRDQLIDIGILIGTDFNPDGVKGIGPKTALKLIKKYGRLEDALPMLEKASFPVSPFKIREIFLNPKVTEDYQLKLKYPDEDEVIKFMCMEHDFNEERVRKSLKKAISGLDKVESIKLEKFF